MSTREMLISKEAVIEDYYEEAIRILTTARSKFNNAPELVMTKLKLSKASSGLIEIIYEVNANDEFFCH